MILKLFNIIRNIFIDTVFIQILLASFLFGENKPISMKNYKYSGFISGGSLTVIDNEFKNSLSLSISQGISISDKFNIAGFNFKRRVYNLGFSHNFTKPKGTSTIFFDTRGVTDDDYMFLFNIGYSFTSGKSNNIDARDFSVDKEIKGFTLIAGLGSYVGIANNPDLFVEGGWGIVGTNGILFLRIGLAIK